MPAPNSKLALWRNTIQLFHETNTPPFKGPFKKLGYKYGVELYLHTKKGGETNPDIVASTPSSWLVLELTTSQNSKKEKLKLYSQIDPRHLSHLYIPTPSAQAQLDVISSRLEHIDDGPFTQILVEKKLRLKNINHLKNSDLKDALKGAEGTDLTKLPDIPITLLPEMSQKEIRQGLIDIVMQIFEPDSQGKTTMDMVEEGLERLYPDKIGSRSKRELQDKVRTAMQILVKQFLEGYITCEDSVYKSTDKFSQHHNTLSYVAARLKTWAGETPTLADFE